MEFRVQINPEAIADLERAHAYIASDSPHRALEWLISVYSAIESLAFAPERCPLAPESTEFSFEIRHYLHGSYRVLFTVKGNEVRVLHIRHGERRELRPGDDE